MTVALTLALMGTLPTDAAIAARLNAYMADAVRFDHFSGVVLVARKGKILLHRAYGFADAERRIPNEVTTRFRIGSVSKQFTAAGVMRLHELGKLRLTDSITKYIDGAPEAWRGITIEHLLNHTSGLVDYTALSEASGDYLKRHHPHRAVLDLVRDKPLRSKPGEVFAYNNTGYYLLGLVVERCAGVKLTEYLSQQIFRPLALNRTDQNLTARPSRDRALGYTVNDGRFARASEADMRNLFAIGGISSTVDDLNRWQKALRTGKVLRPASVEQIFTPGKGGYGYGWIIDKLGSERRYYHDGGLTPFSASLQILPDSDLTVIAISNRGDDGGIRVAYDAIGWICGTPATLRAIQPELFTETAESSFARIERARKSFPPFDAREDKVKELGNYLVISGRKKQAIEVFKLNTLLYPKSAEAHYRLALNYSWAKATDLAKKHVAEALRLQPNHPEAARLKTSLGG